MATQYAEEDWEPPRIHTIRHWVVVDNSHSELAVVLLVGICFDVESEVFGSIEGSLCHRQAELGAGNNTKMALVGCSLPLVSVGHTLVHLGNFGGECLQHTSLQVFESADQVSKADVGSVQTVIEALAAVAENIPE